MANLSDKQRLWIVNSTWTGSWFFFYERASWQSTLKRKTTRGVELSMQLNMPLASWPPAYHVRGFFVSERQGAWGENSWTAGEAAQADHPAQVTAGGSGDLCLRGKLSEAALLRAYSLFQDKLHWGISYLGAGLAQWLGCWTRDPKVTGSSPGRSGGKKISPPGSAFCGDSYFSIYSTATECKRSRSFCQKCRWQVTGKHSRTLCMWLCMKWHDMVHGCVEYTECGEMAAVSHGSSHLTTKERCKYITSEDIFKKHYKKLVNHSVTCNKSALSLLKHGE